VAVGIHNLLNCYYYPLYSQLLVTATTRVTFLRRASRWRRCISTAC